MDSLDIPKEVETKPQSLTTNTDSKYNKRQKIYIIKNRFVILQHEFRCILHS